MSENFSWFHPIQTPIKGPVHNYDPHNFDDVYADEYGGFGSGSAAAGGQGGMRAGGQTRFDQRGGGGNRFGGEKSLNREGNRPPRASGTRDFIDPWAHNGSNANNQIGSNFGGSFNDSSNFMSSNGNNGNGSSVEMENKSSTQVTIPKDVSKSLLTRILMSHVLTEHYFFSEFLPNEARWCNHRKRWRPNKKNPLGVERFHSNRRSPSRINRSYHYHHWNGETNSNCSIHASAKVIIISHQSSPLQYIYNIMRRQTAAVEHWTCLVVWKTSDFVVWYLINKKSLVSLQTCPQPSYFLALFHLLWPSTSF